MTGAQADWLRSHKKYQVVASGHAPSGHVYKDRGMLHDDGTFEPQLGRARPSIKPGSFEVGVLTSTQDLERR